MTLSISERHKDFAQRFLHPNSDTQGDFNGSMRDAGFKRSLDPTSKAVAKVLADTRDELLLAGIDADDMPNPMTSAIDEGPVDDEDMAALEEMLSADELNWQQMLHPAKRALAKIASGKLKASTQQVASIKEILTRAEGRAGANVDQGEDLTQPVRVVLLPTVDHGQGPVIDLGEVGEVDPGDVVPGLTLRQVMDK